MALFTQLLDLTAGMKHRRVVTATKRIANLRQTVVSQLFRQRHRHLARTRHRAGSTLGKEIRDFDLVVLRHRLLNIVDGDQFFLQCQQVAQRLTHEVDGDRPSGKVGIGNDAVQRPFQLTYVRS